MSTFMFEKLAAVNSSVSLLSIIPNSLYPRPCGCHNFLANKFGETKLLSGSGIDRDMLTPMYVFCEQNEPGKRLFFAKQSRVRVFKF